LWREWHKFLNPDGPGDPALYAEILRGRTSGVFSRFREVLVVRWHTETHVATRFSPIPNNTVAATSDSRTRIKSCRMHPRSFAIKIVAKIRVHGGEITPGFRGCSEIGTHLHGSVYASQRRPTDVIIDARRAKSIRSPIVPLSRVHVLVISSHVCRRGYRHYEKLASIVRYMVTDSRGWPPFCEPDLLLRPPHSRFSRHATRAPSRSSLCPSHSSPPITRYLPARNVRNATADWARDEGRKETRDARIAND